MYQILVLAGFVFKDIEFTTVRYGYFNPSFFSSFKLAEACTGWMIKLPPLECFSFSRLSLYVYTIDWCWGKFCTQVGRIFFFFFCTFYYLFISFFFFFWCLRVFVWDKTTNDKYTNIKCLQSIYQFIVWCREKY